jgi:Tfp pilus assembly protein PilF
LDPFGSAAIYIRGEQGVTRSSARYRKGECPRGNSLTGSRAVWCTAASLFMLLSVNAQCSAETDDKQQRCDFHRPLKCVGGKQEYDETGAGSADFFIQKGSRHARNREYELAITAYTEAIRLDPKFYHAFIGRALAYVATGNYDRALEDFGAAIAGEATRVFTPPLRAYAFNGRGRIFLQRAQYDRAIADFTAAIQIDRISHEGYRNRAEALFQQGKLLEALADVDRALWVFPDSGEAYHMRSRIYRELGLADEAQANEAIANDIEALGVPASGHVDRSQLYPATSASCSDGARHTLFLEIEDGKVKARPTYAGSDAPVTVQQSSDKIGFRFGNEGCRIEFTIANSSSNKGESSPASLWTIVPPTVETPTYEQTLYRDASHACAEARIWVRVYWGYVEFQNGFLAPGSGYSGVAGREYRLGDKGCAIELRAARVD